MSRFEWEALLRVLAASPTWTESRVRGASVAAWRARPAPGRWCALEVLAHLRDADLDVHRPRLEALLRDNGAPAPEVDMRGWDEQRGYRDQDPAAVLAAWREARAGLVATLEALGRREWERMAFHSRRGPLTIAEMVRGWADHDLAHRRQLAAALHAAQEATP
jgi:hypothetical protein